MMSDESVRLNRRTVDSRVTGDAWQRSSGEDPHGVTLIIVNTTVHGGIRTGRGELHAIAGHAHGGKGERHPYEVRVSLAAVESSGASR